MLPERLILLENVKRTFKEAGFAISMYCKVKSTCFDLVARKNEILLFVKVLYNVDSLQQEHAKELKLLSLIFSASPLVVGEKSGHTALEDGVVYERYGIPVININSLIYALIEGKFPIVIAKRGGFFVKIDSKALRSERIRKNLSLGLLAEMVGVSRKTIYEYERGSMDATVETAHKLENLLDTKLTQPINIFAWKIEDVESLENESIENELKEIVCELLSELGFGVIPTFRTPFDVVAKTPEAKIVILTGVGYPGERGIRKRIKVVKSISQIIRKYAVFVLEGKRVSPNIDGVPILKTSELKRMEEPEELLNTIIKRQIIN
ncbi:MAG: transcriptional regulator [Candidatus Odinarchaeota archaeon]|nr:transcriptional regulator [Candidatus Odinarchaeota archaeon]